MRPQSRPILALSLSILALLAGDLPSDAGLVRSLDRDSPEISTDISPADILPACALYSSVGPNGFPTLGLATWEDVDAFSQGDSLITRIPPTQFSDGSYYFSVTRESVGQDPTILEQTQGNGAAGDLFVVYAAYGGTRQLYVATDSCELTPGPPYDAQSDVDAVGLGIISRPDDWPVYWSVDPDSSVPPARIMAALPTTGWSQRTYAFSFQLGLQAGDDIDGLCVDEISPRNGNFDGNDRVVFSLTAQSPTLADQGRSPGDVFIREPGETGPLRVFVGHETFGLLSTDDLNALGCVRNTQAEPVPASSPLGVLALAVILLGGASYALLRRA